MAATTSMTKAEPLIEPAMPFDRLRLASALASVQGSAVLESGPGYRELGRYGLYTALPRATFEVRDGKWSLTDDWPLTRPAPDTSPFEALRFLLNQTKRRHDSQNTPIFQGGWVGFWGYDLAPLLEQLPRRWPRQGNVPDLSLAYYDTFAIHDSWREKLELYAVDSFGESESYRLSRRDELRQLLDQPLGHDEGQALIAGEIQTEFTPDEYCNAVARVIEYLKAGDIFQANLSQAFSGKFTGDVGTLFQRTMSRCPVPFGAYLRGDGWSIASASPERFLRALPDGRVETRPIKGTRPRGRDPIHDLLLREELGDSEKDAAELTMIVDLERNDLGRVCEFNSVRVTAHREIESFSSVHHAVSVVEGRLRPEKDLVDLLMATFPGGSITGAPKIRAMQIIDELERGRRGLYTGAIGYISDHGRMDMNIAIRTMVVDGDTVSYRVGGGIVVDSDPLSEYRETLAKGRQMRSILLGEE